VFLVEDELTDSTDSKIVSEILMQSLSDKLAYDWDADLILVKSPLSRPAGDREVDLNPSISSRICCVERGEADPGIFESRASCVSNNSKICFEEMADMVGSILFNEYRKFGEANVIAGLALVIVKCGRSKG